MVEEIGYYPISPTGARPNSGPPGWFPVLQPRRRDATSPSVISVWSPGPCSTTAGLLHPASHDRLPTAAASPASAEPRRPTSTFGSHPLVV